MLVEVPLTSISAGCGRRRRRRTEATDDAIACPVSGTCTAARETDPEVSDLIVAVDVDLDVVAARSQMRMRPTGARPSPSGSATTASPPWLKACWDLTVVACRRRHVGNASANGTVTGIAISTALLARAAKMTAITIASGGTGRMNGRGCTVAALTEVRMRSSPMEMNAHQVLDDAVLMTKTTILAEIRETPRYELLYLTN